MAVAAKTSDRVRIPDDAPAEFRGRVGIVVGVRAGKATVVLDPLDPNEYRKQSVEMTSVTAPLARLEVMERPAPNPNLSVTFKYESGKHGPVHMVDTSIANEDQFLEFGAPLPEGWKNFGWHSLAQAKAIAACYGASFSEV